MLFSSRVRVRIRFSVWLVNCYAHVCATLGCNCHGSATDPLVYGENLLRQRLCNRMHLQSPNGSGLNWGDSEAQSSSLSDGGVEIGKILMLHCVIGAHPPLRVANQQTLTRQSRIIVIIIFCFQKHSYNQRYAQSDK